MKQLNYIFALFLFLLISITIVLFISSYKSKPLVSPVLGVSKLKISDNIWLPKNEPNSKFADAPETTARAAIFINLETGQILYERNSQTQMPIASLTKIMTAIVALEGKSLEDNFIVSEKAANMEPDKMFLIPGERLTLKELLEGMFLVSANDAAEVLAEGTTGRREEFLNLMNSKAKQIGMNNTLFVNPSGLEEDNRLYYSTAYDVLLMSRYAISNWPDLLEISANPHIFIPQTSTHQDYDLYSGINLVTTYPGVLGFKTGFTPEAGLTLVTVAVQDNKGVLGVLLGSTDRRDDAKALLDYSFEKLNRQ